MKALICISVSFFLGLAGLVKAQSSFYDLPAEVSQIEQFFKSNQYGKALALCHEGLKHASISQDRKLNSIFLSLKGVAYLDTINQDSARIFLEQSMNEAFKTNCLNSLFRSLNGLGIYYYRGDNYLTSIKYFSLLKYYAEQEHIKCYEVKANLNLSSNYACLNLNRNAIIHLKQATKLASEMKDTVLLLRSLLLTGNEFIRQNKIDSSAIYSSLANDLFRKTTIHHLGSEVYNSLSMNFLAQHKIALAIEYGRLAIAESLKEKSVLKLASFYEDLSMCFTEQKGYDSAIYFLNKAILLQKQNHYTDLYRQDLKALYQIYKLKNDKQNAMYYLELFVNTDSLVNRDNGLLVDSLKNTFELEKNKLTLQANEQRLKEEYKRQQIFYGSAGLIILLLFTGLPYLFYLHKRLKRQKETQRLLIKVKDSEIKALQSQMNPHFIFNSLNSVLEFISHSEMEEAIRYLTKFSRLIRLVLEFSERKLISLSQEIELLTLYIELEKIKSDHQFTYQFKIDETLDLENDKIHAMMIQPFVENSLIHGIHHQLKMAEQGKWVYIGVLVITLKKQENFLQCTVEDNGIGREKAMEIKAGKAFNYLSLGMRITKDRLDLVSENISRIHYVDLKDENNKSKGTRVEILIPLVETL